VRELAETLGLVELFAKAIAFVKVFKETLSLAETALKKLVLIVFREIIELASKIQKIVAFSSLVTKVKELKSRLRE